jgi:hypothetical protein
VNNKPQPIPAQLDFKVADIDQAIVGRGLCVAHIWCHGK